jgi:ribonuclease HI
MKLVIHIDGGARGNPGPAGAGVVIHDDEGAAQLEAGFYLGRMTNNVAEYTALLRALEASRRLSAEQLLIHSDSELLVKQINGEYRVRNPGLQSLFDEAMSRLRGFSKWTVRHVRREGNARADELANLAMDAGEDVIEIDVSDGSEPRPTDEAQSTTAAGETSQYAVACSKSPAKGACPADCRKGDSFDVADVTPEGLCIHAALSVLGAVTAAHQGGQSRSVECTKPGCGATFTINPE